MLLCQYTGYQLMQVDIDQCISNYAVYCYSECVQLVFASY